MKVSIIINPNAGSVNDKKLKSTIDDVLFRCERNYCLSKTPEDLRTFLLAEIQAQTEFLVVCGGDGTINTVLQTLIKSGLDFNQIPPVCLISSGTANDLAYNLGLHHRVEQTLRLIFEGEIRSVDVIEVEGDGVKSYMLTNGGIGIPAETATKTNIWRTHIRKLAFDENNSLHRRFFGRFIHTVIKSLGSGIYGLTLMETLSRWQKDLWDIEVSLPGNLSQRTESPFILINNQPTVGRSFTPAPFTSNGDGLLNFLIINSKTKIHQIKSILDVARGRTLPSPAHPSAEVPQLTLRSHGRPMVFFGDGEILHSQVHEVKIKCLHPGLRFIIPPKTTFTKSFSQPLNTLSSSSSSFPL